MRRVRSAILAALVSAWVVLVTACATGPEGPGEGGPPAGSGRGGRGKAGGLPREAETWKQYDANGDGKVTRAEFLAVRALCFVRCDGNGDGSLTQAEMRRCLAGRAPEDLGAAMARLDRDKDGEISLEEFERENRRLFELLDANGDGVIAGMELGNLTIRLAGDLCQPSGSPDAGDGRGRGVPAGRPGPRGPW